MAKDVDPKSEEWNKDKYPGSVLLSDHIQYYVDNGELIVDDTFKRKQLKTAKYNVRLGRAYYKDGNYSNLNETHPLLEIVPYELVFVESYEIFRLPKNVVGKYDLRISCCLGGLGLQTGLQLDPGYYGRFFCPLFNFSDKPITITYLGDLASIEFEYTTVPSRSTELFESPRQGNLHLSDALPDVSRRSGLEKLWVGIRNMENELKEERDALRKGREELDKKVDDLNTRVDSMVGINFNAMAFMIGALAVVVAAISFVLTQEPTKQESNLVLWVAGGILSCGLILMIITLITYKKKKKSRNG